MSLNRSRGMKLRSSFRENETWDDVFAVTKPDDILTLINDKLSSAYNNYLPLKQAKPRRFNTIHKPWHSVSLLKSCKKKNKLYKNYLKTESPDLLKKNIVSTKIKLRIYYVKLKNSIMPQN